MNLTKTCILKFKKRGHRMIQGTLKYIQLKYQLKKVKNKGVINKNFKLEKEDCNFMHGVELLPRSHINFLKFLSLKAYCRLIVYDIKKLIILR